MARSLAIILLSALCISSIAPLLVEASNQAAGDNFCQGCRAVVSFARTFNTSKERPEYEQVFRNFCNFYYPTSTDYQNGPCPLFVKSIFELLDRVDPIHHCDQIGACGPTRDVVYPNVSPDIRSMPPKQANAVCEFCETTIEQIQTALADPRFYNQIKRQVSEFCDYLKVVQADNECRQLANKYLKEAMDFVRHIDPLAYCRSVQLCPAQMTVRPLAKKDGASQSRVLNSAAPKVVAERHRLPTLADFNDFGIETSVIIGNSNNLNNKPAASSEQTSKKRSTPSCVLCKTLVKEMFHFLRENKTEANIIKGLKQVCNTIFPAGSERHDQCQSMVQAYTKEIIQLLIDETDPEMICMMLEQCVGQPIYRVIDQSEQQQQESQLRATVSHGQDKKKSMFNLGDLIHALDPRAKLKSAKICFECKMFLKYLKNTMDEPGSREAIKDWLVDNLCKNIPDEGISAECNKLIEENADIFFEAVVGSLDPAVACSDLGACSKKTLSEVLHIDTLAPLERPDEVPSLVVSPKVVENKVRNDDQTPAREQRLGGQLCDQCVQIVTKIDDYLAEHPLDQDVQVLIDNVCNQMPEGNVRNECVYLIQMFGSEIAHAVSTMESPRKLCSKMWLC